MNVMWIQDTKYQQQRQQYITGNDSTSNNNDNEYPWKTNWKRQQ